MKSKILFTLSIILFLSSCSLEKRMHRSGFHFKKQSIAENSSKKSDSKEKLKIETTKKSIQKVKSPVDELAIENIKEPDNKQECDIIISVDGDEYEVIISEIDSERIRYKRCNNLDGPDYLMRKERIFMIKFRNGDKEVFKENMRNSERDKEVEREKAQTENTTKNTSKSGGVRPQKQASKGIEPLSLFSFFSAIASLFILGVFLSAAAVITGVISITRIEKSDNLGGLFFAIVGMIAGLILFFVTLLFLLG